MKLRQEKFAMINDHQTSPVRQKITPRKPETSDNRRLRGYWYTCLRRRAHFQCYSSGPSAFPSS
jgi:hypothetical protein